MSVSRRKVKNWSPAFDPKWDTPKFLLGDAAAASEITLNVLKAWLARDVIGLNRGDLEAGGKGSSRLFTLRTVVEIAVMAELVRLGLPPHRARGPASASLSTPARVRSQTDSPTYTDCLLLVFPANVGKIIDKVLKEQGAREFIFTFFGDQSKGQITDTVAYGLVPPDDKSSIHEFLKRARRLFTNPPASVAAVSIPAVLEQVRRILSARGKLDEEI